MNYGFKQKGKPYEWIRDLNFVNYLFAYDKKYNFLIIMSLFSGKIIQPYLNNKGYWRYMMRRNNGNLTNMSEHRLIAKLFIYNHRPDTALSIDHINRNTKDNSIKNLRWATRSEQALNRDCPKNNKLQIKNVFYHERDKKYCVKKTINKISDRKYFKKKEDAINYANNLNESLHRLGIATCPLR
jgi:hypothetical protein